jgi:hypothetical protein
VRAPGSRTPLLPGWGALTGTYHTGGRMTFALPVSRHTSVKLYASTGVSTRTSSNFDMVGIYVQYRWGRGL